MTRHLATITRHLTDCAQPLGPAGERIAVTHLVADDGLEVVACNWEVRRGEVRGELDVVALDHDRGLVVVTEVKTRRSLAYGGPLAAVTVPKQQRIRTLTTAMLIDGDLPYRRVRFDVVGILVPPDAPGTVEHVEGAF